MPDVRWPLSALVYPAVHVFFFWFIKSFLFQLYWVISFLLWTIFCFETRVDTHEGSMRECNDNNDLEGNIATSVIITKRVSTDFFRISHHKSANTAAYGLLLLYIRPQLHMWHSQLFVCFDLAYSITHWVRRIIIIPISIQLATWWCDERNAFRPKKMFSVGFCPIPPRRLRWLMSNSRLEKINHNLFILTDEVCVIEIVTNDDFRQMKNVPTKHLLVRVILDK